jgi:hypothetical protein
MQKRTIIIVTIAVVLIALVITGAVMIVNKNNEVVKPEEKKDDVKPEEKKDDTKPEEKKDDVKPDEKKDNPPSNDPSISINLQGYTAFFNKDSPGSDINIPVKGDTQTVCKQKCDSDPNCKGFTYKKTDPTQCWLKSVIKPENTMTTDSRFDTYLKSDNPEVKPVPEPIAPQDSVSLQGYTLYKDKDSNGSDISKPIDGDTPEMCKKKCDSMSSCKGFGYKKMGSGGCWTKSSIKPESAMSSNIYRDTYAKSNLVTQSSASPSQEGFTEGDYSEYSTVSELPSDF